ncbi:glycosyltransferase family 2 protein [Amylibacter sp.]|nr:glycosyltransferase family 2 protein [Amylibacter sp.]
MGSNPNLISVIIPTHDRAPLLMSAIESVLMQKNVCVEIIIVDDNSTDDTREKILEIKKNLSDDKKISYHYVRFNSSQKARNYGLKKSCGEFVQFLDSDDLLGKEKFYDALREFARVPSTDIVFCKCQKFQGKQSYANGQIMDLADFNEEATVSNAILNGVWTASPLFRRNLLEKVGKWDESLPNLQDKDYISRAIMYARNVVTIDCVQAYMREHSGCRISGKQFGHEDGIKSVAFIALKFISIINCEYESKFRKQAQRLLNRQLIGALMYSRIFKHKSLYDELCEKLSNEKFSIIILFKLHFIIKAPLYFLVFVMHLWRLIQKVKY